MQWAFRPHPLGFENESRSRDARTINGLQSVLTKRFNEGVTRQIFFEASQFVIERDVMPEIPTRAAIFAHRLFMALAPFFQSSQLNHFSIVNDPLLLKPLRKEHMTFKQGARKNQPVTRDVLSRPETNAHEEPLPGSTRFEHALTDVFEKALRTRYQWEQSHDGEYEFVFPTFKQRFQEGYHYNEEFLKGSTNNKIISTEYRNRVFVTTMFGVEASIRKRWTDDFTDSELMSRPSVFNLD